MPHGSCSLGTRISTSTRRSRFPTNKDRARLYMGNKWWAPPLQGVPPASPFGPQWKERWLAAIAAAADVTTTQHQQVKPLLDMDPQKLYDCSVGKQLQPAPKTNQQQLQQLDCNDDNVRRLAHNAMEAALLVQEFQQRPFSKHLWNVWRYEGILGFLAEWKLPRRDDSSGVIPTYLWNHGSSISVATTLWNTATPVFGRVRDANADKDEEYFRNQRHSLGIPAGGSPSLHPTILWPLDMQRKRKELTQQLISRDNKHLLWDQKEGNTLYWRGNISVGEERRAYVELYSSSTVVDLAHYSTKDSLPEELMEDSRAMQHKYLLALEGVDVPDDLLWKMYSNSVVFMPEPTYVSWAMETLLVPYVHYLPVNRNNLEEQLNWANKHPDECKEIAAQSSLWVHDLLFHPESVHDEEETMRIMIHRYQQFLIRAKPIVKWSGVWNYVESRW
eukprot:CAMPEP_0119030126 /NCGR_PEP_ID=MMETSP1176-20130426/40870_1 /TAXON_ID=265551 /ORGANISM="Synedropsis recta cf, Strain CCMP1620" /LENGTH=444 /DNA_ID=CAMNT_0006986491 /DNA_START=847 /DNA_END=2178 /DNA_ORIENTATION=-